MRIEDAIEVAYKNGYEEGKKCAIPQGHWDRFEYNTFKDSYVMFSCSNCNQLNEHQSSYCPNCGSKMKRSKV